MPAEPEMWNLLNSRDDSSLAVRQIDPLELDLEPTLDCGQAFRWKREAMPPGLNATSGKPDPSSSSSPRWTAVVASRVITLWREQDSVYAAMRPGPFDRVLLDRYLDLSLDLASVRQEIAVDPHISAALDRYPGLRILQQEPWECLVSFILSQWSNVPRIAATIERLSRRYGEEICLGHYRFPTPAELAAASPEELRAMGLGYRVDYVLRAAQKCAEQGTRWLEDLARVDYRTARDTIVLPFSVRRPTEKVHGVGPKVADCVLLFSLRHFEAFPADVHVRRAMERWYGDRGAFTSRYDSVGDFGRQHFGRYAGYAQQYLFHAGRLDTRKAP